MFKRLFLYAAAALTSAVLLTACSTAPGDTGPPRLHHDELPVGPTRRIESDRSRQGDLDYVFDTTALPLLKLTAPAPAPPAAPTPPAPRRNW